MNKQPFWLPVAQNLAGTKSYISSIVVQVIMTISLLLALFYNSDWAVSSWVHIPIFIICGIAPIYHIYVIKKLLETKK